MSNQASFSPADQAHMRRALELAELGRYTVTPNPCVGAVIVDQSGVIGEGWHARAGQPHAEIFALREAGARAQGATIYVTLEPCSHTGRTGPCVDALIDAGVARVVFAMGDPNPNVSGAGGRKLRAAGIAVSEGLLQREAEALNAGFHKRMQSGRPLVTMKLAASLDGRSAMASGESQWITGELARSDAQRLRAASCAILTGSATVLNDDPRYTVRAEALGQAVQRQPDLWIADSELSVPPGSQVVSCRSRDQRGLVLLADSGRKRNWADRAEALVETGAEIVECQSASQEKGLNLTQIIDLAGQREINNLLIEAGPRLSGSFIEAGLVDEIVYYLAPKILGSSARPVAELPLEKLEDSVVLETIERKFLGEDLRLHGRVARPEQ